MWQRFQQHLCQVPSLGLTLDVSRMRFDDGFLDRMAAPIERAFEAMDALERGRHRQSGREPHGRALLAARTGPGAVAGNRGRDSQDGGRRQVVRRRRASAATSGRRLPRGSRASCPSASAARRWARCSSPTRSAIRPATG